MELIRKRAYARAGLVGNPSDGYHGKTISIIVGNFWADVVLYEWEEVEIIWSQDDQSRFKSLHDLVADVRLHGYYGGIRLVKATVKKFVEHCQRQGHRLHDRNFSIRYQSNIPRQVGLAGSSAKEHVTHSIIPIPFWLDPKLYRSFVFVEVACSRIVYVAVVQQAERFGSFSINS